VRSNPNAPPEFGGARVLIVEDEGIIARDIEQTLIGLGYSICDMADDGEEAIEKAIQAKPDAVLMDIRLRGRMDGILAAQLIRERLSVPISLPLSPHEPPSPKEAVHVLP
jgi:CheY-like chemotaxis protein